MMVILTFTPIFTTIFDKSFRCCLIHSPRVSRPAQFPAGFLVLGAIGKRLVKTRRSARHRLPEPRRRGIALTRDPGYWASNATLQDPRFMAMIRALQLLADKELALTEREAPPAPGP